MVRLEGDRWPERGTGWYGAGMEERGLWGQAGCKEGGSCFLRAICQGT